MASLLWSLGVLYITYTTTHSHNAHRVKVADIQRRATDTLQHARRTIGYKIHRNPRQEKLSPSASVTKATDVAKSKILKSYNKKLKSQQVKQQMKPTVATLSMKFSTPSVSVSYKSKQTISVSEVVTDKSQISRSPLFVSDRPVAVMGVDFWMEAGRTRTDEEKQQKEAGFTRHAFNQYASDRLGYFREIPDTRHAL